MDREGGGHEIWDKSLIKFQGEGGQDLAVTYEKIKNFYYYLTEISMSFQYIPLK